MNTHARVSNIFLHHFVLAKLASSSIRVKGLEGREISMLFNKVSDPLDMCPVPSEGL